MTEYRDLSKLPQDQAYWDDLEARVLAGLNQPAAPLPEAGALAPLAARAWPLAGFAIAAMTAAILLVPHATATVHPAGLLRTPQDDPAISAFMAAPAPPSVASLVLSSLGNER